MSTETHDLGDARDLQFTITVDGTPTDPTNLRFDILEPDGLTTTYYKGVDSELELVSTGVYRVLWICRKAGWHFASAWCTGNVDQREPLQFYVAPDQVFGNTLPDFVPSP